jgi:hypothetical protein
MFCPSLSSTWATSCRTGKQGIKWTKGFYGVELRNVQIVHRRLYIFMSQEIFKCDNIESVFE